MYTELRYDDRQIPIKLIHFIAVFLGISYVHAGLNPLTEVPDTHAKLSGLAGQLRSQSHLMSLSLWLCYVLGQTNDTCCRCRFSLCFVPTVGSETSDEPFAPKHYCTLAPDVLVGSSNIVLWSSGRVISLQPRWFTHGRHSPRVSCEGQLLFSAAVD